MYVQEKSILTNRQLKQRKNNNRDHIRGNHALIERFVCNGRL